jgi:putative nucleotide binding protein
LTSTAKSELPVVLEKIIVENKPQFITFFNTTQAVTPRMHSLELVPGIGKKYMWAILQARERKSFDSFQEIQERTGIPDPVKLISKRILEELLVPQPKYRLFTRSS